MQDCQQPEYGWISAAGTIQYASPRFGSKTCGSWYTYSNGCYYNPPPPPPVQVSVTAFICGSSNYNYWSGVLSSSEKNIIISEYRNFSGVGRCPEHTGFVFWQNVWLRDAMNLYGHISNPSLRLAYAWPKIRDDMQRDARNNGEHLRSYQYTLDAYCRNYTGRSNAYYVILCEILRR